MSYYTKTPLKMNSKMNRINHINISVASELNKTERNETVDISN